MSLLIPPSGRTESHFFKQITSSRVTYRQGIVALVIGSLIGLLLVTVTGCKPTPPDYRKQVTAPVYEGGDSERGELLYEENCLQCHKLIAGKNKKGPQLIGVYAAPSATLEDYNYSDAMDNANWVWDVETMDRYIADPEAALPDTRMLSDPIANAQDRQDIIAYLSTLGRDAPPKSDAE